jgi:hypothetical protein
MELWRDPEDREAREGGTREVVVEAVLWLAVTAPFTGGL